MACVTPGNRFKWRQPIFSYILMYPGGRFAHTAPAGSASLLLLSSFNPTSLSLAKGFEEAICCQGVDFPHTLQNLVSALCSAPLKLILSPFPRLIISSHSHLSSALMLLAVRFSRKPCLPPKILADCPLTLQILLLLPSPLYYHSPEFCPRFPLPLALV